MRDVVNIGQRWCRREDCHVIVIRQVHRADALVEVEYERPRFTLDLHTLGRDYTLDQGRHER